MKWSLRRRIEAYLKRTRMPATRFGLEAARDPRLVFELRRGRSVRPPLEAKIVDFMNRPEPSPRDRRRPRQPR
ncbi:MAG TPA: hypothetical protein VFR28_10985 [Allosphingosinicella sp.]|nr:hypothetical protein [Allosphingosinicella sp.]